MEQPEKLQPCLIASSVACLHPDSLVKVKMYTAIIGTASVFYTYGINSAIYFPLKRYIELKAFFPVFHKHNIIRDFFIYIPYIVHYSSKNIYTQYKSQKYPVFLFKIPANNIFIHIQILLSEIYLLLFLPYSTGFAVK